jgi:hypothetical protein
LTAVLLTPVWLTLLTPHQTLHASTAQEYPEHEKRSKQSHMPRIDQANNHDDGVVVEGGDTVRMHSKTGCMSVPAKWMDSSQTSTQSDPAAGRPCK